MDSQLKLYYVYKHTNKHNGKVYIGITCREPEVRWNNGKGYENNEYLYRAIQKYGWHEGFIHEILAKGLDKETACRLEIELIATYDSANYKNGYNCSTGGECGNAGCRRTDEWVFKMRKSLKKCVICVETGVTYDSATDAEIQTKINKSSIGKCCRNHCLTAGGFHWCFLNEYPGKRSYLRSVKDQLAMIDEEKKYETRGKSNKKPMGKRNIPK